MKREFIILIGIIVLTGLLLTPSIIARQTITVEIGVIAATSDGWETSAILFGDIIGPEINEYIQKLSRFRFWPPIEIDFLVEHADGSPEVHQEIIEMFHENGIDLIIGGFWSSQAQASLDYVNENDMLLLRELTGMD